jgi:poly(beta-D-mannuronate) C5 epimerase
MVAAMRVRPRRSSLAGCIAASLLLLAPAAPASVQEEGDDGADEIPAPIGKPTPTAAQLVRDYHLFAKNKGSFVAPRLPDLSRYSDTALKAKIDRSNEGSVVIGPLLAEPGFKSLTTAIGQGLRELALRQTGGLRAIIVEGGYVEWSQLGNSLPKEVFEETQPGVYVARLPVLIRHGATLYIGPGTRQIRLSQERGAILANEGMLFIVSSQVTGWSEQRHAPATFHDKHEFRPFIISWGGSQTYISHSTIAHLGYATTKSFGLSLSQYSTTAVERAVWPRPTGWVLNSHIEDLWYGFYCWEADDVVLRGNTFRNNIKYGIDPHDRSRRLIIAENDVFGTREKHGIIISREVNDSWIIGNRSHENTLSGIVLDRQCQHTVIANNLTFRNHSDGIVISESSHNLVWSNLSVGNTHHGIRLRNSGDVRIQDSSAIANGLAGIYGVSQDLSHTDRNLDQDPYQRTLSMVVAGGQLSANGSGPINVSEPSHIELLDIDLRTPQRRLGYRFGGALLPFQIEMLDILLNRKQVSVLEARVPHEEAGRAARARRQRLTSLQRHGG